MSVAEALVVFSSATFACFFDGYRLRHSLFNRNVFCYFLCGLFLKQFYWHTQCCLAFAFAGFGDYTC